MTQKQRNILMKVTSYVPPEGRDFTTEEVIQAMEEYARSKWDEACEAQMAECKHKLALVPNGLEYISLNSVPNPQYKP